MKQLLFLILVSVLLPATLSAATSDKIKPTVTITAPTANQRWSNSVFTVKGKATDNAQVSKVFFRLNAGAFAAATGTTNWEAVVTLLPGTNTIRAYAVDSSGNSSSTNSASFFYVVNTPLVVRVTGNGAVNPNYNGQLLEIGKGYTMTATPAKGFGFSNWTGSVRTNKAALSFVMASNLTFTANFVDTQKPTVAITTPTANLKASNSVLTIKGTAADNAQIKEVRYQLNSGLWVTATGTNTWQAAVTLSLGTNSLRVYALDGAGNSSPTNSVSFSYLLTGVQQANAGYYSGTWTQTNSSPPSSGKLYAVVGPDGTVFVCAAQSATETNGGDAFKATLDSANHLSATIDGAVISGSLNPATHVLSGTFKGSEDSGTFTLSRSTTFTFNFQPPQGTYVGTYTGLSGEEKGDSGNLIALVRPDGTLISLNYREGEDGSGGSFSASVTRSGILDVVVESETQIRGVVSDNSLIGVFKDDSDTPGETSGSGTFNLSRRPDTGIQSANAGYYTGTATGQHGSERLDAILAADGTVYVVGPGSGVDDSGFGFKGAISAANKMTATLLDPRVTGTLNPTTHQITGTFVGSEDSGTFLLQRTTSFVQSHSSSASARAKLTLSTENQELQVAAGPSVQLQPARTHGSFDLTFNSQMGRAYVVQASSDLLTWTEVTNVTATGASTTIALPTPPDTKAQFYRIVSP